MRVSEILRKMAEIAELVDDDAIDTPDDVATDQIQQPVDALATMDQPGGKEPAVPNPELDAEQVTMVSPLQQEHELLKKSQGVDNHVSEFAGDDDEDYDSELSSIKQMAGIKGES